MIGIYVMLIGGFMGLIFLFSAAGRNWDPKVNRALIGFSAIALALFGVYQVWQGTFR